MGCGDWVGLGWFCPIGFRYKEILPIIKAWFSLWRNLIELVSGGLRVGTRFSTRTRHGDIEVPLQGQLLQLVFQLSCTLWSRQGDSDA